MHTERFATMRVLGAALVVVVLIACGESAVGSTPAAQDVAPTGSSIGATGADSSADTTASTAMAPAPASNTETVAAGAVKIEIVEAIVVADDLSDASDVITTPASTTIASIIPAKSPQLALPTTPAPTPVPTSVALAATSVPTVVPTSVPTAIVIAPTPGPTPSTAPAPPPSGIPTEGVSVGTTISFVVTNPDGTIAATATYND